MSSEEAQVWGEALDPEMRLQDSHAPRDLQGTWARLLPRQWKKLCVKTQAAWEVEMKQMHLFPQQLETILDKFQVSLLSEVSSLTMQD